MPQVRRVQPVPGRDVHVLRPRRKDLLQKGLHEVGLERTKVCWTKRRLMEVKLGKGGRGREVKIQAKSLQSDRNRHNYSRLSLIFKSLVR